MDITEKGDLVIPSIAPYLGITEKARLVFDIFTDRGRYVFAPYTIRRYVGIPRSKIVITNSKTYEIEDDILSISIDSRRGTIKKWRVDIANEDGSYTNLFSVGNKLEIYLGYGDYLTKVCSGLIYSVDQMVTVIVLEGYDWTDYLAGPDVVKEYYDRDWGYILRDLITSYTTLDPSNIPDIGKTTGGVVSYIHTSLWDIIQDILNIIDYDLVVDVDKKVYIYKRVGNANWTISDTEVDDIDIEKTSKKVVNRVIIYGDKEKFRDSFLQTDINKEIWDENYFANWSIANNNLVYSGTADGYLHTTMRNYNYKFTVFVKQDTLEYRSGKASLQAKGGITTRYSFVEMISDTPIYSTAEDTSLQVTYGIKELLLRKPEITLRTEADRVAKWELLYRKVIASAGKITIDGYEDIREGHILRLYLPEIGIYDKDYEVIGTTHKFREYWTTELELAEVIPGLEDVLRYLRQSITKPEKKLAIFRITEPEDSLYLFTDETPSTLIEEKSIGNCRIGISMQIG